MKIKIQRARKTNDGMLGGLTLDADPFSCFTVENLVLDIPAGTYVVKYSYSPHFNRQMPHIIVPGRSDIMFHWANYPVQLKGCIAVGDKEEPDAVDDSIVTFNRLDAILKKQTDITLDVVDIPQGVSV